MFFLLKLLFLPIWLPLKIISELIEHSGRGRRRQRSYGGRTGSKGGGCLAVVLVVVVVAAIGAIANACSSPAQPAGNNPLAASTTTASASPTPSPSTTAHHARHRRHHKRHHHHRAAPTAPVATHSAPAQPSCYPLSDEGTCYEPGEFCRHSDEGASGVAGDGERIECEDNDGWRWEPV